MEASGEEMVGGGHASAASAAAARSAPMVPSTLVAREAGLGSWWGRKFGTGYDDDDAAAAAADAAAAAAEEQHRQFLFQVTGEVLHVVWDKMQEKPCSRSLKVVTGAEEDERLYSNTELCCSGWYVFKIAIILSSQSTRLEGNLQSSRS